MQVTRRVAAGPNALRASWQLLYNDYPGAQTIMEGILNRY